jgi:hypothetical protein
MNIGILSFMVKATGKVIPERLFNPTKKISRGAVHIVFELVHEAADRVVENPQVLRQPQHRPSCRGLRWQCFGPGYKGPLWMPAGPAIYDRNQQTNSDDLTQVAPERFEPATPRFDPGRNRSRRGRIRLHRRRPQALDFRSEHA